MDYREKLDYSSLSTYLDCPRKFLFQYVLNLRSPRKSIHLVFGSCWHYGLEVVYRHLMEDKLTVLEATKMSIKGFNDLWAIEGKASFPDEDIIFPKSPGHAANMYKAYWERFLSLDLKDKTVLDVETPFTIDLSHYQVGLPNYIGRIDLILALQSNGIEIIDHKTAKAIYPTAATAFEASFQTDGYLTAGRIYYDVIPQMTYRVALCQKSRIGFEIFTVNKRVMAIEHFLANLVFYADEILQNLKLLEEDFEVCKNRNDILKSFPRRSGYACTTFMSACPYFDLCRLRNNPLIWANRPPQGFEIFEWDPDAHGEDLKNKLEKNK